VRAIGAHPSIRARPRQLTLCFQVNRERDVVGERVTVEAREPGVELGLEVRERGDLSEMREGLLAHATPEALHLAARRRIVGLGVHQGDPEARAHQL